MGVRGFRHLLREIGDVFQSPAGRMVVGIAAGALDVVGGSGVVSAEVQLAYGASDERARKRQQRRALFGERRAAAYDEQVSYLAEQYRGWYDAAKRQGSLGELRWRRDAADRIGRTLLGYGTLQRTVSGAPGRTQAYTPALSQEERRLIRETGEQFISQLNELTGTPLPLVRGSREEKAARIAAAGPTRNPAAWLSPERLARSRPHFWNRPPRQTLAELAAETPG